jgi:hypothetical protein
LVSPPSEGRSSFIQPIGLMPMRTSNLLAMLAPFLSGRRSCFDNLMLRQAQQNASQKRSDSTAFALRKTHASTGSARTALKIQHEWL